ncbi:MAG: tyrosine-type recombinase/integrase [Bacteroidales bacterium]|nr:tyrosine-type recombinase/integrase [Candidatus Colimorpha onthohippi]
MTVGDAIQRYLLYVKTERRMSPATYTVYESELNAFAAFLNGQGIDNVEDIIPQVPRMWQMQCAEQGKAPRSILRMLSSLRGWCRYCRRMGWIHVDFMAKTVSPKCPKSLPVFFREHDAEQIYNQQLFPDTFEGCRDQLILQLLYETGMRRGELVMLCIDAIDVGSATIKVLGKRNKERYIPIENELLQNILHYITLRNELPCEDNRLIVGVNGKPCTGSQIYSVVRKYMSFANADKISPHVFRHSFATHILNQGGDIIAIKELLGHSSLAATEVYTHVSREHLKEAYNHAHPRAGGNGKSQK